MLLHAFIIHPSNPQPHLPPCSSLADSSCHAGMHKKRNGRTVLSGATKHLLHLSIYLPIYPSPHILTYIYMQSDEKGRGGGIEGGWMRSFLFHLFNCDMQVRISLYLLLHSSHFPSGEEEKWRKDIRLYRKYREKTLHKYSYISCNKANIENNEKQ